MIQETTPLGAAYLAGLAAGVYPEPPKFAHNRRLEHRFKPEMSAPSRERKLKGWARAVKGVLASDDPTEACSGGNNQKLIFAGFSKLLNFRLFRQHRSIATDNGLSARRPLSSQ